MSGGGALAFVQASPILLGYAVLHSLVYSRRLTHTHSLPRLSATPSVCITCVQTTSNQVTFSCRLCTLVDTIELTPR